MALELYVDGKDAKDTKIEVTYSPRGSSYEKILHLDIPKDGKTHHIEIGLYESEIEALIFMLRQ